MEARQFRLPVRLVPNADEPVTEIYSSEEALAFLLDWPIQKGPLFQKALDACLAASVDEATAEEARKAFVSFVRVEGLLSRDSTFDRLDVREEARPASG